MAQVMMPFINGKGGVGKTALACSYAAFLALQGADVTLLDLNEEQRTALAWSQVRNHNSILPKVRVEASNPRQALEMVGRHDYLLVDTPGWTDKTTLSLAKRATFMVIPTGPNATYELAPTVRLLHGLRAEGIEPWRMGVVLSRFSSDDKVRADEEQLARAYLKEAGYVALEGCLPNASAFTAGLAEGYGLSETTASKDLALSATRMMETISKGLASAERRLQRGGLPGRAMDRDRGGRDV